MSSLSSSQPKELPGLRVTVDKVVYTQHPSAPPDRPHCFVYFITIHNDSERVVTIQRRKWVIKDDTNDVVIVEGDGVVGQTPTIIPGNNFSYNSFHLMGGQYAAAEGAYLGQDEEGKPVVVKIPKFEMRVPKGPAGDAGKMWA
jgi:ApaG protein